MRLLKGNQGVANMKVKRFLKSDHTVIPSENEIEEK
jgi:hypothetical protein